MPGWGRGHPCWKHSASHPCLRVYPRSAQRFTCVRSQAQPAIELILQAVRADGDLDLSVEVTPHNLLMTEEDFERIGSLAKVIPPQRKSHDLAALWEAIKSRELTMVVATDHAPHLREEKERGAQNIWEAIPGFPGVQTMLPLMLDQVSKGRIDLADVVRLCSLDQHAASVSTPRRARSQWGRMRT